jgi:hypothetical protein
MRCSAFIVLFVSILGFSFQSSLACGGICRFNWYASPNIGKAPLLVSMGGETDNWDDAVRVDLGSSEGGILTPTFELYWDESPCDGEGFRAQHEYTCPGTYTVKFIDPDHPGTDATETITVSTPKDFALLVFAGNNDHEAFIATDVNASQRPFTYSSVDWGDGSSQPFTYVPLGPRAGTPAHAYAAEGEYTATITHHYVGQYCSWEQTETVAVTVPVITVATRPATWGYVKSIYR